MRIILLGIIVYFLFGVLGQAGAAVLVDVDLSKQRMHVTTGSGEEHDWPISSARTGYVTPTGTYHSQHLERLHFSKKYDNAPMPFSIFFRGGYAIHATNAVRNLGRPASHGCIRLAPVNAERLYGFVRAEGAVISITRSRGGASAGTQTPGGTLSVETYPSFWNSFVVR